MSNTSEGLNWNLILGIGAVLVLLIAFSLPSLIVFAVGLLPTGVAFIIDRSDQKTGTFCVGGMNLCGVFPYVIKLWTGKHTPSAATEIISDVLALLVMYAAAGGMASGEAARALAGASRRGAAAGDVCAA